jgi:hypothetical protein
MQALRKFRSITRVLPLLAVALAFSSCATTKKEAALISDGSEKESTLPWNQQQKWEQYGQMGAMAERFETRR